MQCQDCKPQFEQCKLCNNGEIKQDIAFTVNVPGGIQNNNTLRLAGAGHYVGQIFNQDKYSDIMINITVEPNSYYSIKGQDLVTTLDITLLEALTRMY